MMADTTTGVQRQLEELIGLNADVELQFSDGSLSCNSTVLSVFSSVLRGAVEAHTAGSNASKGDSPRSTIPVEGLTREERMQVAGFLYPVVPAPTIKDWQEAEFLLEAGKRYGLSLVLHKVDKYLASRAVSMVTAADSPAHIWRWIRLADEAGLQQCLPRLIGYAVDKDQGGCSGPNLQGLSATALRCLLETLSKVSFTPIPCSHCPGRCTICYSCGSEHPFYMWN